MKSITFYGIYALLANHILDFQLEVAVSANVSTCLNVGQWDNSLVLTSVWHCVLSEFGQDTGTKLHNRSTLQTLKNYISRSL